MTHFHPYWRALFAARALFQRGTEWDEIQPRSVMPMS
jgi:hypothetical protein